MELRVCSRELTAKYNAKVEHQECLIRAEAFFKAGALFEPSNPILNIVEPPEDGLQPLLVNDISGHSNGRQFPCSMDADMKFSSTVGILNSEERARFERMLFRSTRGNCLVRFAGVSRRITDTVSGKVESKIVFIVFFKSEVIETIINKICAAFGARRYPVPDHTTLDDGARRNFVVRETAIELADAREVLFKNRELRLALCSRLAQHYLGWNSTVRQEKAIYHVLNLFSADVSGMLRAEGWIVSSAEADARALITRTHAAMDLAGASMFAVMPLPWPSPPTTFETNDFTDAYQEFVNTYGVPRYKEINPAVFTAVTFPFFFGMMYGDVGHGICIFFGGLYLLCTHRAGWGKNDEMLSGIYSARYMLIMMGASAIYVGFVYNDCFSLCLALFDSGYRWDGAENGLSGKVGGGIAANTTAPYGTASSVYPFGVDPVWHVSENELLFFNSMKMKIAVVFGVTQMTVGIILKGLNAFYFGERAVLYLEFVPMCIFDFCLFIYMVILIFTKWAIDWNWRQLMGSCTNDVTFAGRPCANKSTLKEKCPLGYGGESNGCSPPNLINQLINIALNPGVVEEPMYNGQGPVQSTLLVVAFMCVPVLLFGKPVYRYFDSRKFGSYPLPAFGTQVQVRLDGEQTFSSENRAVSCEDESFSEDLIHQCIETIEFVLGMISNTASYLRLWALSLAHSELAQVFWQKTILAAVNSNNGFFIFTSYLVFAAVTAAVLLAMDLLECFLHALRLHWVEFQSKFYKADGIQFAPLDLENI